MSLRPAWSTRGNARTGFKATQRNSVSKNQKTNTYNFFFWAGDIAQQLKVLAAESNDLSSIPETHDGRRELMEVVL